MPHIEPQVSAGGVVYRIEGGAIQVILISVGDRSRWQLPKGLINPGETNDSAALREVLEETGAKAELVDLLDKIEYWYFSGRGAERVLFHKTVFFYLMRYLSGSLADHDAEVNEACWVGIDRALEMLSFENEKKLVGLAKEKLNGVTA